MKRRGWIVSPACGAAVLATVLYVSALPAVGKDPPPAPPADPTLVDPAPAPGIPEVARPLPGSIPAPITTTPTSSPVTETAPTLKRVPPPSSPLGVPPPTPEGKPAPLPGDSSLRSIVGFVRVRMNDPAAARPLAANLGLAIHFISPDSREMSVSAPQGTDLNALLIRLKGDPRVKSAELEALGFVPPTR